VLHPLHKDAGGVGVALDPTDSAGVESGETEGQLEPAESVAEFEDV
jgi:hypothetical protein